MQKAWLASPIEVFKGSRVVREEHMRKLKQPIQMPDITQLEHLKRWIVELGIYGYGVNGCIPLPFQEIQAWNELTMAGARPKEVMVLRDLSRAYCGQYHKSDVKCPPPYKPKGGEDKAAMGAMFLSALDSVNDVGKALT